MKKKIIGLFLVFAILTVTLGCGSTPTQSTTTSNSEQTTFATNGEHVRYIWNGFGTRLNKRSAIYYENTKTASYSLKIEKVVTGDLERNQVYRDTCKLAEITFSEIPEVELVIIDVYADLTDNQANVNERKVYWARVEREKASKINWSNVGTLSGISYEKIVQNNFEYWMHAALQTVE